MFQSPPEMGLRLLFGDVYVVISVGGCDMGDMARQVGGELWLTMIN
jgi:hypothetical protein